MAIGLNGIQWQHNSPVFAYFKQQIEVWILFYIYTWNPNGAPCFDWKRGLSFGGFKLQNKRFKLQNKRTSPGSRYTHTYRIPTELFQKMTKNNVSGRSESPHRGQAESERKDENLKKKSFVRKTVQKHLNLKKNLQLLVSWWLLSGLKGLRPD